MRRPGLCLLVVLMGVTVLGCRAEDGAGAVLTSDPPWGLDSVDTPSDAVMIADLFAVMPSSIDGVTAKRSSQAVVYDDDHGRYLQVRSLAMADYRAKYGAKDASPLSYLSGLAESGEWYKLESTLLDPAQPLVWVAGSGQDEGKPVYLVLWGESDGEWLFIAMADTPSARTDLVHAFIVACQTASSTSAQTQQIAGATNT